MRFEMPPQAELRELCLRYRVRSLHLFGSCVRGEAAPDSDVDLLVEFERTGFKGAFDQFMDFKQALESLLNRPVDLVIATHWRNPQFAEEVSRTKQLIYAA